MGVTSQIIEAPAKGLPFVLKQGGDEQDDFIYNKDSALGIYLATVADKLEGIVRTTSVRASASTLNDFAAMLAASKIPGADIDDRPRPQLPRLTVSARRHLRYQPRAQRTRLRAAI